MALIILKFLQNIKQSRNTVTRIKVTELIHESGISFNLSHMELHLLLDGFCDRITTYQAVERLVYEGNVHKGADINAAIKHS